MTMCRLAAVNHAQTRSLTCNRGAISWKAHRWPISCTIADSAVPMGVETVFCITISHAPYGMLVLRMSQSMVVHPFASVFLMHQIACWFCACHSLLAYTRLNRYFSCTRLQVGFVHVTVYCRAPVCIGSSHAPDCMLVLRMSQSFAVHPFASVFIMHQIACWFCACRSLLPCTRLHRYFSCTRLHVGSAPVRRFYCARSQI